ncbi:MAG TPA: hypothetical protein VE377_09825 [Candidatus Dormibacteraeota bacterium]|nr:hypothetical protein [Candidatus Dormibacteraeota bacterium]
MKFRVDHARLDEPVNMIRHHPVPDHHEAIALARLFQNREEAVAAARRAEKS